MIAFCSTLFGVAKHPASWTWSLGSQSSPASSLVISFQHRDDFSSFVLLVVVGLRADQPQPGHQVRRALGACPAHVDVVGGPQLCVASSERTRSLFESPAPGPRSHGARADFTASRIPAVSFFAQSGYFANAARMLST